MAWRRMFERCSLRNLGVLGASALSFLLAVHAESPAKLRAKQDAVPFGGQSQEQADRKSTGCMSCHTSTDEPTMHATKTVSLGCTDCHGGNASIRVTGGIRADSAEYQAAKEK